MHFRRHPIFKTIRYITFKTKKIIFFNYRCFFNALTYNLENRDKLKNNKLIQFIDVLTLDHGHSEQLFKNKLI